MPSRSLALLALVAVAVFALRAALAPPESIASTVVREAVAEKEAAPSISTSISTSTQAETGDEPRPSPSAVRVPIRAAPLQELPRVPGMALVVVQVTDEAGCPIPDALVNATGTAAPCYEGRRVGSRLIWTDDDGRVAFLTLPSERLDVAVITKDGLGAERMGFRTPGPDEGAEVILEVPSAEAQLDVVVFVRSSSTGSPIEGASVSAQPALTLGVEKPVTVESDGEGRAVVALRPGDRVHVTAPGHSSAVVAQGAGSGAGVLHVGLLRHARVEGRILIAPGALEWEGGAAWSVRLWRLGFGGPEVIGSADIDADGRWSIDSIEVHRGNGEITGLTLEVKLGSWSKSLRTDLGVRAGETVHVEDTFRGERVPRGDDGRHDGWLHRPPARDMTYFEGMDRQNRRSGDR